jgi:hypothetical protein
MPAANVVQAALVQPPPFGGDGYYPATCR